MERTLQTREIKDEVMRTNIVNMYNSAFAGTDDVCIQDQICYDTSTLDSALLDSDYLKFVLLLNDEVVGLCLLTNNLVKARIAYCNDRYLRQRFPNYTALGKLFYVTCICVLPEMQSRGVGMELIKSVTKFIFETGTMVCFDFSEEKNPGLTTLIQHVAKTQVGNRENTGEDRDYWADEIPLGSQRYTSLHCNKFGIPD